MKNRVKEVSQVGEVKELFFFKEGSHRGEKGSSYGEEIALLEKLTFVRRHAFWEESLEGRRPLGWAWLSFSASPRGGSYHRKGRGWETTCRGLHSFFLKR